LRLLENLVLTMEQTKKIKREDIPSALLFDIFGMNRNNISKLFSDSRLWMSPASVDSLSEQGLIQKIATENDEQYALTFKGVARAIEMKHGASFEHQFTKFLELSDQKFNTGELSKFRWDEKLASMSLILVASTSVSSAVRLNNEGNKTVLGEVFDRTLICLKKYGIIGEKEELKTKSRGESPVSALMSRLNSLSRKTNHYYTNIAQESGYFFDIEKDGGIDEKRLFFLLRRIFEHSRQDCRYEEMYTALAELSQRYLPRFRDRITNPVISLTILKKLKEFTDFEIWHLPPKSQIDE
jgi:predicted transcriptional regulator